MLLSQTYVSSGSAQCRCKRIYGEIILTNVPTTYNRRRELSADSSATLHASASKRACLEKPQFKSKGNEQQYGHQLSVLECVDNATSALEHQDIDKALGFLQEGKVAIEARMKLIKLADSCDHGWQTVAEYMTNELADN